MKYIYKTDFESWADAFISKGDFPTLMSRLVMASTPKSTSIHFPSGISVYSSGWDGIIHCPEATAYVPLGTSLWEFGTTSGNNKKAEDDYTKRSADPLGYDPKNSTFIFVTLTHWNEKDIWRTEKLKEGVWKDIKTYDSRDLEAWIETVEAVARWFSAYIGKYPSDGIESTEEFWKYWSIGPITLLPHSVTAGREFESQQLLDFLNGDAGIKAVKGSSKEEAIAFIVASAKQFEQTPRDSFFSRSLIIDTIPNYKSICTNHNTLILIPQTEDKNYLYYGVSKGHHVLVPLGPDDTFNQDTITLPKIDRDRLVDSLVNSGLSKEDAAKFSKESGKNITILKGLLKFPQSKLEWLQKETVREIIPAMLLGRWDENKIGDREIIEKLSGAKYDDYIEKLIKWVDYNNSPIIKIGSTWRLTSSLDAWANLSSYLTKKDLENLQEQFYVTFKNGNPDIEPEKEEGVLSHFFPRKKRFSEWSREGLVQSLILIGIYGDGLKLSTFSSSQKWVDDTIKSLLDNASEKLWISLNHEMPLIAEASPKSFFEAIDQSLSYDNRPIIAMFIETRGLISSTGNHTGLLWALEGLAWIPEYLYDSSRILAILTVLDPGGSITNRPANSLKEIFKPWHYQTLASFEERMEVLQILSEKEKAVIWSLLIGMLPENHAVAFGTYKMPWRIFDKSFTKTYSYEEIYKTYSYVVDLLIKISDFQESEIESLIEQSVRLFPTDRNKILSFIKDNLPKIIQVEYNLWNTLRGILSRHRSYPDAEWTLPESELSKYAELYKLLEPTDEIIKNIWLFGDGGFESPEGFVYDDYKKRDLAISNRRREGLKIIYQKFGLEKVKQLSSEVKDPWIFGETLAYFLDDENELFSLLNLLGNKENVRFINGFIVRKSILKGIEWVIDWFRKLKDKGILNQSLVQLLIPVKTTKAIIDFINTLDKELQNEYWSNVHPNFYGEGTDEKNYGLKKLIEAKRYITAIHSSYSFVEEISSDLLAEILTKAATEETNENLNIDEYHINKIFEKLYERNDLTAHALSRLEWFFLPLLSTHGYGNNPKVLHEELSSNPEFFIEVLKNIYKPKDEEKAKIEADKLNLLDEKTKNMVERSFQLIKSWKTIPGTQSDGSVDFIFLNEWINKVRESAIQEDRIDVADMHIGKILAQYPEKSETWPPDEICTIIERIDTTSIKNNFRAEVSNKRSFSSRGAFDGGNIEREKAKYFSDLAARHKKKFSKISAILQSLADTYEEDAKSMDERAEREKLDY